MISALRIQFSVDRTALKSLSCDHWSNTMSSSKMEAKRTFCECWILYFQMNKFWAMSGLNGLCCSSPPPLWGEKILHIIGVLYPSGLPSVWSLIDTCYGDKKSGELRFINIRLPLHKYMWATVRYANLLLTQKLKRLLNKNVLVFPNQNKMFKEE